MYIDYNKLKEFFEKLNQQYEENNIDEMINLISTWEDLNKLLNVTEIIKQKNELENLYELKIADYSIGWMKSNLDYDINLDKNKLRFINYLVKYYEDARPLFLRALLDINIKLLKENINNDITFKTEVIPKSSDKEYLSSDLYMTDSYIYHSIYFDNTFIGIDMMEGYGYKSETDFTKEEDVFEKGNEPLSTNTKLYFLKSMKRYNDNYFDKYKNLNQENKFHGM